ncbi:hypothetical protein ACM55I_14445 [Flavobacterium sp. GB2R13]|uniref:hypothetical protein n=1 Tax=Flavobacterium algoris TaxID=3398733 RepID=UPI003A84F88E
MEIIKLQELQDNFYSAIENSINQKFDINREMNEIQDYIKDIPNYSRFRKAVKPLFNNKANRVFKINISDLLRSQFSDAFNSYIRIGSYELKSFHADTNEMHQIKEHTAKQAYEFSEYYKWLDTLLTSPQKAEKKNEGLSHKEKMLALYYLGLDMRKFRNNLQSAKILSKILDLDESNTKDNLTYFDGINCKVKTETNLKKVLDLFEHKDFKEIHVAITKDLEK